MALIDFSHAYIESTYKGLDFREQIAAIAQREAAWARQIDRDHAQAQAWLAEARALLRESSR